MKTHLFIAPLESRVLFASIGPTDVFTPRVTVSGIVYADANKNNQPDPGEGVADCVVTFNNNADHSVSTPISASDGSYTTQLEPGTYDVQVDGPNTAGNYDFPNVVVGDQGTTFNPKVQLDDSHGGGGTQTPSNLAVTVSKIPNMLAPDATKAPVTVTVTNTGGAFKGAISATVYFSTDQTIDAGDAQLPTVSLPLVKIGTKPKSLSFNAAALAGILPTGDLYVLVKIDATPSGSSSTSTTGVSSSQMQVLPASINLVPSFKGKLKVSKTHKLPFHLKVTNTGSAEASGPLTISLAARPVGGGSDISLPSLGPISIDIDGDNHFTTLKQSADVSSLAAGSYQLVMTISATVTPAESSTSDNTVVSAPFVIK